MNSDAITVGPDSDDLRGSTGRVIQIAIDALHRRGGGTVTLLPGTYLLDDSVRLAPDVTLRGSGPDTVLRRRMPAVASPLAVDADKAQSEITPLHPERFRAGMGVALHDGRKTNRTMPLHVTRIVDGVLHLDGMIDTDYIAENGAVVVDEFPMIHGFRADGAVIEDLVVDGGGPNAEGYGSPGIYARTCRDWRVSRVSVRNCVGDGIILSQQSVGGVIEDSEFCGHTNFGVHPGSHSARCRVSGCRIHHNGSCGLYICWGIRDSVFVGNEVHHNGLRNYRNGISIGHKDTDNLIADNHVHHNAKHGIHVRVKTAANGAHRNVFRGNLVEDNGSLPDEVPERWRRLPADEIMGVGISVYGITRDLLFEDNVVRETRSGDKRRQKHGFLICEGVSGLRMRGNRIEGHPGEAVVDRSGDPSNRIEEPVPSV